MVALRIIGSLRFGATKLAATPDEPSTPEICDRLDLGASAVKPFGIHESPSVHRRQFGVARFECLVHQHGFGLQGAYTAGDVISPKSIRMRSQQQKRSDSRRKWAWP